MEEEPEGGEGELPRWKRDGGSGGKMLDATSSTVVTGRSTAGTDKLDTCPRAHVRYAHFAHQRTYQEETPPTVTKEVLRSRWVGHGLDVESLPLVLNDAVDPILAADNRVADQECRVVSVAMDDRIVDRLGKRHNEVEELTVVEVATVAHLLQELWDHPKFIAITVERSLQNDYLLCTHDSKVLNVDSFAGRCRPRPWIVDSSNATPAIVTSDVRTCSESSVVPLHGDIHPREPGSKPALVESMFPPTGEHDIRSLGEV